MSAPNFGYPVSTNHNETVLDNALSVHSDESVPSALSPNHNESILEG